MFDISAFCRASIPSFKHIKLTLRGPCMEAGKNKRGKASTPAKQNLLRAIPQVDEVLQWLSPDTDVPMFLIKQSVREELETLRQNILAGKKVSKNDLSKKKLLG